MKHYGNIDLNNNQLQHAVLPMDTDFPAEAIPGSLIFKNKKVYICTEVDVGVPVWIQLTQSIAAYIHTQTTAQTAWTIDHNLNTALAIVQVFDANNQLMIPDYVDVSTVNRTIVMFSTPQIGKAIVMLGSTTGDQNNIMIDTPTYQLPRWRNGELAPLDTLGSDGDYYLATSTGDVYTKANGVYTLIANIKGSGGTGGSDGSFDETTFWLGA